MKKVNVLVQVCMFILWPPFHTYIRIIVKPWKDIKINKHTIQTSNTNLMHIKITRLD